MAETFPCSPYDEVSGLVYFARMLHKIRLHAEGKLPESYHPLLGDGFDGRCLNFLHLNYEDVRQRVLAGQESDEQLLEWCYGQGRAPSEEEVEVWNDFMRKRGWRDPSRDRIDFRVKEAGLEAKLPEIATMFDFIDVDEGRQPPSFTSFEPPRR